MPFVVVHWWAGRTPEQKRELARRITQAMCEIGRNEPHEIQLIFADVPPGNWLHGDRLGDDLHET